MTVFRVLRVLEYRYADAQVMAEDMSRWHPGANAVFRPNLLTTISSATHLPEAIAEGDLPELIGERE